MILTINEHGSLILIDRDNDKEHAVETVNDIAVLTKGESFMCSSTIDFPEEATTNPAVIRVCRQLRGYSE